jgi:hypothetical protein
MKILDRRIVTKASDDVTFEVGDHIQFYDDGTIGCVEAGGWVIAEDVPEAIKGMEHAPDTDYINRQKAKLMAELARLIELEEESQG